MDGDSEGIRNQEREDGKRGVKKRQILTGKCSARWWGNGRRCSGMEAERRVRRRVS